MLDEFRNDRLVQGRSLVDRDVRHLDALGEVYGGIGAVESASRLRGAAAQHVVGLIEVDEALDVGRDLADHAGRINGDCERDWDVSIVQPPGHGDEPVAAARVAGRA